ncbi:MAG: PAP2 family protein, partial [Propionibacteriaceae bacterium]|nr:PAP2 family protein [Propionibacteriaceae bacterium]
MDAATPEQPVEGTSRSRGARPNVDSALLLTGIIGGVVFAALMLASAAIYDSVSDADGVSSFDKPALDWAVSQRSPAVAGWVTAFTDLGRAVPMVVMAGLLTTILFLAHRRRTIWVLMLVAAGGSISQTLVGKALVGRSRPELDFAVPPFEDSFSFPSGHALNSTVVAGMLAYLACW